MILQMFERHVLSLLQRMPSEKPESVWAKVDTQLTEFVPMLVPDIEPSTLVFMAETAMTRNAPDKAEFYLRALGSALGRNKHWAKGCLLRGLLTADRARDPEVPPEEKERMLRRALEWVELALEVTRHRLDQKNAKKQSFLLFNISIHIAKILSVFGHRKYLPQFIQILTRLENAMESTGGDYEWRGQVRWLLYISLREGFGNSGGEKNSALDLVRKLWTSSKSRSYSFHKILVQEIFKRFSEMSGEMNSLEDKTADLRTKSMNIIQKIKHGKISQREAEKEINGLLLSITPLSDFNELVEKRDTMDETQKLIIAEVSLVAVNLGLLSVAEKIVGILSKSKSLTPEARVWVEFTKAELQISSGHSSDHEPPVRNNHAVLAEVAIENRTKSLKRLKSALEKAEKYGLSDQILEEGCCLIWNTGLPLLRAQTKHLLLPAFETANQVLEKIGDKNFQLRININFELSRIAPRETAIQYAKKTMDLAQFSDDLELRRRAKHNFAKYINPHFEPILEAELALERLDEDGSANEAQLLKDQIQQLWRAADISDEDNEDSAIERARLSVLARLATPVFELGQRELCLSIVDIVLNIPVPLKPVTRELKIDFAQCYFIRAETLINILTQKGKQVVLFATSEISKRDPEDKRPQILEDYSKGLAVAEELKIPWLIFRGAVSFWNNYIRVFKNTNDSAPEASVAKLIHAFRERLRIEIQMTEASQLKDFELDLKREVYGNFALVSAKILENGTKEDVEAAMILTEELKKGTFSLQTKREIDALAMRTESRREARKDKRDKTSVGVTRQNQTLFEISSQIEVLQVSKGWEKAQIEECIRKLQDFSNNRATESDIELVVELWIKLGNFAAKHQDDSEPLLIGLTCLEKATPWISQWRLDTKEIDKNVPKTHLTLGCCHEYLYGKILFDLSQLRGLEVESKDTLIFRALNRQLNALQLAIRGENQKNTIASAQKVYVTMMTIRQELYTPANKRCLLQPVHIFICYMWTASSWCEELAKKERLGKALIDVLRLLGEGCEVPADFERALVSCNLLLEFIEEDKQKIWKIKAKFIAKLNKPERKIDEEFRNCDPALQLQMYRTMALLFSLPEKQLWSFRRACELSRSLGGDHLPQIILESCEWMCARRLSNSKMISNLLLLNNLYEESQDRNLVEDWLPQKFEDFLLDNNMITYQSNMPSRKFVFRNQLSVSDIDLLFKTNSMLVQLSHSKSERNMYAENCVILIRSLFCIIQEVLNSKAQKPEQMGEQSKKNNSRGTQRHRQIFIQTSTAGFGVNEITTIKFGTKSNIVRDNQSLRQQSQFRASFNVSRGDRDIDFNSELKYSEILSHQFTNQYLSLFEKNEDLPQLDNIGIHKPLVFFTHLVTIIDHLEQEGLNLSAAYVLKAMELFGLCLLNNAYLLLYVFLRIANHASKCGKISLSKKYLKKFLSFNSFASEFFESEIRIFKANFDPLRPEISPRSIDWPLINIQPFNGIQMPWIWCQISQILAELKVPFPGALFAAGTISLSSFCAEETVGMARLTMAKFAALSGQTKKSISLINQSLPDLRLLQNWKKFLCFTVNFLLSEKLFTDSYRLLNLWKKVLKAAKDQKNAYLNQKDIDDLLIYISIYSGLTLASEFKTHLFYGHPTLSDIITEKKVFSKLIRILWKTRRCFHEISLTHMRELNNLADSILSIMRQISIADVLKISTVLIHSEIFWQVIDKITSKYLEEIEKMIGIRSCRQQDIFTSNRKNFTEVLVCFSKIRLVGLKVKSFLLWLRGRALELGQEISNVGERESWEKVFRENTDEIFSKSLLTSTRYGANSRFEKFAEDSVNTVMDLMSKRYRKKLIAFELALELFLARPYSEAEEKVSESEAEFCSEEDSDLMKVVIVANRLSPSLPTFDEDSSVLTDFRFSDIRSLEFYWLRIRFCLQLIEHVRFAKGNIGKHVLNLSSASLHLGLMNFYLNSADSSDPAFLALKSCFDSKESVELASETFSFIYFLTTIKSWNELLIELPKNSVYFIIQPDPNSICLYYAFLYVDSEGETEIQGDVFNKTDALNKYFREIQNTKKLSKITENATFSSLYKKFIEHYEEILSKYMKKDLKKKSGKNIEKRFSTLYIVTPPEFYLIPFELEWNLWSLEFEAIVRGGSLERISSQQSPKIDSSFFFMNRPKHLEKENDLNQAFITGSKSTKKSLDCSNLEIRSEQIQHILSEYDFVCYCSVRPLLKDCSIQRLLAMLPQTKPSCLVCFDDIEFSNSAHQALQNCERNRVRQMKTELLLWSVLAGNTCIVSTEIEKLESLPDIISNSIVLKDTKFLSKIADSGHRIIFGSPLMTFAEPKRLN